MKSSQVSYRLRQSDLDKLKYVQKELGKHSQTEAIRSSIKLAMLLVNFRKDGCRLIVEEENGRQKEILILDI